MVSRALTLLLLIGSSDQQHISFRHDRIRDQLLIDAAAQLAACATLTDDTLQDPHFAEVIGGVLAQRPDDSALLERIVHGNPLALFYAYRKACTSLPDRGASFGGAITSWLSNEGPLAVHNRYLRWECLKVLANTERAAVIGITQQLGLGDSWLGWHARFRNGDILAGLTLCLNSRPATIDPSRNAQIAHAKHKFGFKFIDVVDQLLRQDTTEAGLRVGALRMAGHLAEPSFAEAIRTCWSNDPDRLDHASDYLWAAARCYGSEDKAPLSLILDAWSELPARDQRAHDDLRSAFGQHVPTAALRYLVERGDDDRLRWPTSTMLMEVDDPIAIEFVAGEMARQLQQAERTSGITLYFDHAAEYWERRQEEDNVAMSAASRGVVFDLWNAEQIGPHLRKAAFRLWISNEVPGDLEILQQDTLPPILEDNILRERLVRKDTSALPLLRPKLEGPSGSWWWWYARYIWSDEMAGILDAELAKYASEVPKKENVEREYGHLSYLMLRMSPAVAETLLVKYWPSLQGNSDFVQTALLVGTPKLLNIVKQSVDAHPNPSALFQPFHAQTATFLNGCRVIARESQVEALAPYLSHFKELDLLHLGQICNSLGFTDVRARLVDPAMRAAKGTGLTFLDEAETFLAFDRMTKPDRLNWIDRWLEDFLETGASQDRILAVTRKWFAERRSHDALQLVCGILVQIGQRKDLEILEVVKQLSDPAADALRQDTRYVVRRRSLL